MPLRQLIFFLVLADPDLYPNLQPDFELPPGLQPSSGLQFLLQQHPQVFVHLHVVNIYFSPNKLYGF